LNGKKILLTDDEPNILRVVTARLVSQGYQVMTAADGEEALAKARSEKPDLMLLDVLLPHIDGYKVCETIKGDSDLGHIPVILFSAKTQTIDRQRGKEAGADAYIAKPFQPDQLLETIKNLLKGSRHG